MTDRFKELLKLLIEEYALNIHKAPNYTDTYTRNFLISKFIPEVIDKVLYWFCIEVSKDKHEVHEDYVKWIKQQDSDRKEEELDKLYKLEPYNRGKFTEEDVEKYKRLPKKSLKKLRKKQGLE